MVGKILRETTVYFWLQCDNLCISCKDSLHLCCYQIDIYNKDKTL